MRTIPAFGEPQDGSSFSNLNSLKILYMSHLALGDYIYQGPFLKELVESHPCIELDIWIDDCRKKKKPWHRGRSKSLVQWLSNEQHINYVYPIPNSSSELDLQIQEAHLKDYDVVVFVATNRPAAFAKTAVKIINHGKVFGTVPMNRLSNLVNYAAYNKLDGKINLKKVSAFNHISDFYQHIFRQLFAISIDKNQRLLKLDISLKLKQHCLLYLESWANKHHLQDPQIIFINHLSTCKKRDWKLSQLEELLLLLGERRPQCLFILNAPPNDYESLNYWATSNPIIKHLAIEAYTAKDNFFELPALMSHCSLVISVETAIMHLASSLNIQQIALIRQSAKHWRPLNKSHILKGEQRVDSITPHEVFNAAISVQKTKIYQKSAVEKCK